MTIKGTGFGNERAASFVEIGGSSLTASAYLVWSATEIKLKLPSNLQDGLVYIVTRQGRSEPVIFANRENIPLAITQIDQKTTLPLITKASPQKLSTGQTLTITGSNFGAARGENTFVYFTPGWQNLKSGNASEIEHHYIQAMDNDFDYEFWSDTEIRVRVPDGAATGSFMIKTDKGISNKYPITVTDSVGTKQFLDRRIYVVQVSADISDVQTDANSLITLRMPRPQLSANQPGITMTECTPPPIFPDHNKSVIHQFHSNQSTSGKTAFKQTFAIPVYRMESEIHKNKVRDFSEKTRLLYTVYTSPDECIPSDAAPVKELVEEILGRQEENPYEQAYRIYEYMLNSFQLLPELLPKEVPSLSVLSSLQGDAYDFAIIFTALCRAAGIPAIPVSGVLVDNAKNSRNHWWTEIYFEGFGWMPVDLALAAGMDYPIPVPKENRREYYFGNLDNQHIAFSRGWNQINPTIVNNKTVYRPKTYALQSIWEEATVGTINYSSFWSDPVIVGIY